MFPIEAIFILLTDGPCHQSNDNRSPQSEVVKRRDCFRTRETQLGWKPKGVLSHSLSKGEAHFYKVPALVPDWSISMQMLNPNLYILIGPLSIVLMG